MAKLDAYIPIDRRFALTRDEPLPDRASGAVLFADISGFSTTAAALEQELGPRQGADELMMHVNQLYTGLVNQVHRYGGSVIGFSGDGMTCWFDQQLPGGTNTGDSAQRATACAMAMQDVIGRAGAWRQLGTRSVAAMSIKVSVVSGSARRFLCGSPQIQFVEILAGSLLDRSAAAEHVIQPGQVAVGAEVLGSFGPRLEVTGWVEGSSGEHFALVSKLVEAVAPAPWPEIPAIAVDTARSWLLPPIYRRLQRGEESFLAELRPSVALFLRFSGINYDADDEAGEKLDAFVQWVQEVLQQYGGYLLQVTVGDKGSYAMASTSATMAHEDDAMRAVAATQALLDLPPELNFISELKAGISWGTMLVGAYGSDIRRAFSEQGSETNLAARLMEAAEPGEILITSAVAEAAAVEYDLHDMGALQVKGWAEAVPAFAVESRKRALIEAEGTGSEAAPIIGRHDELMLFRSRMEALKEGYSSAIVIQGEPGIGKSRLVASYLKEARLTEAGAMLAAGDAIERAKPFHAWRPVFRSILQLEANEPKTAVRERISAALPEMEQGAGAASEYAALIDNALALSPVEDGPGVVTEGGVGASRNRELLLGILSRSANGHGQVLILDDAQWVDSASWALLNDIRREIVPLLIVVASRPVREDVLLPKEFEALLADPETARLDLATLAPEESTAMVAQRLGVRSLPEQVSAFIRQRAGGHPFFSEEIAYALVDEGILQIQDNESRLVMENVGLDHLDFPSTVQGVITSRIDRLNAATQLTLKIASVIGPTFTFENLYDVHPVAADKENLREHLKELARLDIAVAEPSEGKSTYVFKHTLIQEIAYGRLLIAQRRQLHRAVGEWLENTYAANSAPYFPLLAYHWGKAAKAHGGRDGNNELPRKALLYADKSGEQALRNSAYREAINFYTEALALGADPALEVSSEQRANCLQLLGEAYHQWGQWSEARDNLKQAAALYGRPVPSSQTGLVGGMVWAIIKQTRNRLWPSRYVGKAPESEKETILKIAHLHQTLSELSFLTNDSTLSLYAVMHGLNLSEYGGVSPELVKAYTDICVIIGIFGPQRMAKAYGERAWAMAEALDNPAVKAAALAGIGLNQMNAGELELAQENFDHSVRLSEELGDRRLWGDSLGLLARTIRFRGELQAADDLYAVLAGPRSGVMMHRVWALNARGLVALRQGDVETAMAFLDKARTIPGEKPEPQQEMITWAYVGIVCMRRGELEMAKEAADKAAALMEQVNASAYTNFEAFAAVAEIYMSLWEMEPDDESAEAKGLVAASRKLCDSLRRGTVKTGRASSWLYLGRYNILDGHLDRASKNWAKGLAVAEEVGMRYELGRIHLEMGRCAEANDPQRMEHLKKAEAIFEEIGVQYYLERTRGELRVASQSGE